jgi:hypothetical protein
MSLSQTTQGERLAMSALMLALSLVATATWAWRAS